MPELRWTLLIIGVVFVAVLAWWERRKPHQAAREAGPVRPSLSELTWGAEPEPAPGRTFREPTLTLPEVRTREPVAQRRQLGLRGCRPDAAGGNVEEPRDPCRWPGICSKISG